ncbi:MAG: hypothetical protein PF487_08950 [Bacteroidales bacterium]|jgi:hypothetical protein|nr:hypothetical protein [Bacteroidales bacterium]
MKRSGTFNKVTFEMIKGNGYGQYYIISKYKGVDLKIHTTNSDAWDWINDESNKEKHIQALRSCYLMIVDRYRRN